MRNYLIIGANNVIMATFQDGILKDTSLDTVITPDQDVFLSQDGKIVICEFGTTPCPEGYSDPRNESYVLGSKPDGKGGWIAPPPPPPVPITVPAWAAKAAIAEAGLTDRVAAYAQGQRAAGKHVFPAKWEGATTFRSDDASLKDAATTLSLSDDTLAALFTRASAIAASG